MNWSQFFAMGGYGLYVWGSYALAAIVLVLNIWLPLARAQAVRRELKEFYELRDKTR